MSESSLYFRGPLTLILRQNRGTSESCRTFKTNHLALVPSVNSQPVCLPVKSPLDPAHRAPQELTWMGRKMDPYKLLTNNSSLINCSWETTVTEKATGRLPPSPLLWHTFSQKLNDRISESFLLFYLILRGKLKKPGRRRRYLNGT